MALLKVFISSTCYDLGTVRAELRTFVQNLGHDPIMSDFDDVLYNPNEHTHESCIKEITNTDIIILIIGSRYGGRVIPKALNLVDLEKLESQSKSKKILQTPENISITQLEVLRAIELNIPIYTFIDSKVFNDHHFYEKNKNKDFIDELEFTAIDKKETAIYIFEFINFIRLRAKNNSIFEYSKISDIELTLKKQLSALLQRFITDQRNTVNEAKQFNNFSEELKDIKSLILSSINNDQAKEVGRGVIKYRKAIEFVYVLSDYIKNQHVLYENVSWLRLLSKLNVKKIVPSTTADFQVAKIYLIKNDDTFYEYRAYWDLFKQYEVIWNEFILLSEAIRKSIIDAIIENASISIRIESYDLNFDDFMRGGAKKLEDELPF